MRRAILGQIKIQETQAGETFDMTNIDKQIENISKTLSADCIRDFHVKIDVFGNSKDFEFILAVNHISADSIKEIEEQNKLEFLGVDFKYSHNVGDKLIELRFKKK